MRSDVQTVIAALTAERDALTRAIESLEQIGGRMPATTSPQRTTRKGRGRAIPSAARAEMVAAMRASTYRIHTASELAVQFGIEPATVRNNWRQWEREIDANGNRATPLPTREELVPA